MGPLQKKKEKKKKRENPRCSTTLREEIYLRGSQLGLEKAQKWQGRLQCEVVMNQPESRVLKRTSKGEDIELRGSHMGLGVS